MNPKERLALLGAIADAMADEVIQGKPVLAADVEDPGQGTPFVTLTFEDRVIRLDATLWTVLEAPKEPEGVFVPEGVDEGLPALPDDLPEVP